MSKANYNTPQRGGVTAGSKVMSSKLANMKRASPSSAASPAATGSESDVPSAKRVKTSHSNADSPAALRNTSTLSLGANTTETMWTLPGAVNENMPKQVQGDSSDDSDGGEEEEGMPWQVGNFSSGRMMFGDYKAKPKRVDTAPATEAGEGEGEESTANEEEDPQSGPSIRAHHSSAGARKFAEENLVRVKGALADKKRPKEQKKREVRLNRASAGRIGK